MKDGITSTVKLTLDKDLISKTLDRQVRVVLTVARMGVRGAQVLPQTTITNLSVAERRLL